MKRLIGLALVFFLLFGVGSALAASTATQTLQCFGAGNVCRITITWVAHTDGSFTWSAAMATTMAANIAKLSDYYLYLVGIDPGATAPTAAYDITLTRSATGYSYDIFGGRGADLSATATKEFIPANDSGSFYPPIGNDIFTLAISNNSVNGANGVIRLWFVK